VNILHEAPLVRVWLWRLAIVNSFCEFVDLVDSCFSEIVVALEGTEGKNTTRMGN